MLRLNKDKHTLPDVFGVTDTDARHLFEITKRFHKKDTILLSSVLQRLWIDEQLSDNIRCWAIFELGRWLGRYESDEMKERGF